MPRDTSKSRKKILEAAFIVFVKKTIEAATFDDVAEEAKIGVATVYRHFGNKQELAAAVCADQWKKHFAVLDEERPLDAIADIPAYDRLDYTLSLYVRLFDEAKDLLKYNDNFNHFIAHYKKEEGVEFAGYVAAIEPIRHRYHLIYEKAKEDGTVRTDIEEGELLRLTLHTMMAACHHFAGGFTFGAAKDEADYSDELCRIKDMILEYVKG